MTAAATQILPVTDAAASRAFLRYPYERYRGHPLWVPPPVLDQRALLNRRRHPFYRQAEVEFFLAWRNGVPCGRVAAIVNRAYNDFHQDRTGFFGFFECEENTDTARALLNTACDWLAARGRDVAVGPVNPSTNYECALLVDGFHLPPAFMMPYNPPSYPAMVMAAGFTKARDLLAYAMTTPAAVPARLENLSARAERRARLTIRPLRLNRLTAELELIFSVYNDAWQRNWGFVPMSREELGAMAASLRWVCDPRIVLIAERDGQAVGFLLAMPDLNRVLPQLGGTLFPFGWWRLLRSRRRLGVLRVLAMGMRQEDQHLGFAAALYRGILMDGAQAGYRSGEIGWVLEDNVLMNRAAEMLGAWPTKRYRLFQRPLRPGPPPGNGVAPSSHRRI